MRLESRSKQTADNLAFQDGFASVAYADYGLWEPSSPLRSDGCNNFPGLPRFVPN